MHLTSVYAQPGSALPPGSPQEMASEGQDRDGDRDGDGQANTHAHAAAARSPSALPPWVFIATSRHSSRSRGLYLKTGT